MSDLAAAALVLRSIVDVAAVDGALGRLREELSRGSGPGALREPQLRTEVFAGLAGTGGAGAAASVLARRADDRLVVWTVEVWIDTWGEDDEWSAVVKADVEVAVPVEAGDADPEVPFDVERTAHDAQAAADAVAECAALLAAFRDVS